MLNCDLAATFCHDPPIAQFMPDSVRQAQPKNMGAWHPSLGRWAFALAAHIEQADHCLGRQLTLKRFLPLVGRYRSSSSKSSMVRFLGRPLLLGLPWPGACTARHKAFRPASDSSGPVHVACASTVNIWLYSLRLYGVSFGFRKKEKSPQ